MVRRYAGMVYNYEELKTRPRRDWNPNEAADVLTCSTKENAGMYDHTIPTSVSNNDRTHFTFQGIKYEIVPETGGVLLPLGGKKHPGRFALVDIEDVPLIAGRSWFTLPTTRALYAQCRQVVNGKTHTILMHRVIMGVTERRIQVDHINHNGLDNRRQNLRLVTNQDNAFNRRPRLRGTSRFKGVHWDKSKRKWCVSYTLNQRKCKAGCFDHEVDAARAYDEAIREHHGEFAWLNFPEESWKGGDRVK